MEIKNKTQLLEFIRKESLKLLEQEAFSTLERPQVSSVEDIEEKLKNIDKHFVEVSQKELEKLQRDEKAAIDKEEYVDLQKIKQDKVAVLNKLIAAYDKKSEYLSELKSVIVSEIEGMGAKGSSVFKNKPINEFTNEDLAKGSTVKIKTLSSEITLKKISDNNQYQVLNTNAKGIQPGDIITIPLNVKIGSPAKVTVYRTTTGERPTEIGSPTLNNITQILKNPA